MASSFWTNSKPPSGTQVDASHPLAHGLVFASLCDGLGTQSWPRREGWKVAFGSPGLGAGEAGQGLRIFDVDSAAIVEPGPLTRQPSNVSLFVRFTTFGAQPTTGNARVFSHEYDSGNNTPFVSYGIYRPNNSNVNLAYAWNNGTFQALTLTSVLTQGATFTACLTISSTTATAYLNGTARSSTATGVGTIAYSSTSRLILGAPTGTSDNLDCIITAAYIWRRVLTASEVAGLHAAPYAFYAAPAWRRYFVPAAAGGGSRYLLERPEGLVAGGLVH